MIHGELMLSARSRIRSSHCLRFLRDDPQLPVPELIDICGVDYPDRVQRFDVVYNLLSIPTTIAIRVKVRPTRTTAVPSVSRLYQRRRLV